MNVETTFQCGEREHDGNLLTGFCIVLARCAGTFSGWFVMVKDNVGRFSGNKLWGDGWGWSWFDATNPQKTTSTGYTTDCQPCHEEHIQQGGK